MKKEPEYYPEYGTWVVYYYEDSRWVRESFVVFEEAWEFYNELSW